MKQPSTLPAYISDPLTGESISSIALANREGLHIRTLRVRWKKGQRGKALIAPPHIIRVTDPNTAELMSLSALAIRYNLRSETVRQRYHDGLRGHKLIAPPKKSSARQPQITSDKLPVRWFSLENATHKKELSALQRHAEDLSSSFKATLKGQWLTKPLC